MTKRTDVHRPSAILPQDYELVEGLGGFQDYGYPGGGCAHCGHAIRYAVRFKHLPSGDILDFGEDCANLIDLENRVAYIVQRMKNAAREQAMKDRAEKQWFERREDMEDSDPDVVEWMETQNWDLEKFAFLNDMKWAFDKYGSLTPAQTGAVRKIMARRIEQAEARLNEVLPTTPAPEGRVEVEGEIVYTKYDSDANFPALKMLVKLTDNNKVWGTVPRAIEEAQGQLKGTKVKFTAAFTRSNTDDHFSFYKRPTKAEVINV